MYGRHLFFFGLYLGLLACPLLAVADFTASDSAELSSIGTDVNAIRGKVNSIQSDIHEIDGYTYSIDRNVGLIQGYTLGIVDAVQAMADDVSSINTGVSSIDSKLYDIGTSLSNIQAAEDAAVINLNTIIGLLGSSGGVTNSTSGVSGVITNIVNVDLSGISNAIANLPLCSVVVTNFLTSSGQVDLSIVSNLLVSSSALPFYTLWFPDNAPFFNDFLARYFGLDEIDWDYAKSYYAMSEMGFLNYLLVDALFPSRPRQSQFTFGDDNLFYYSWRQWHLGSQDASGSTEVEWPYTIFGAYNTVFTTNLLARILSKMDDISSGSSSSTAEAVASINSSVYTSAEEIPLDWSTNANHVEWEETYHTGISEYTNALAYQQYSDQYVESVTNMFSKFTTQLNSVQSDGDPLLNLAFSGWHFNEKFPLFPSIRDGWQFDMMPDPDDPHWKGFSDLTHGVWLAFWRLLQAFVVIYGSVRVYKIVFPAGYYDIS